MDVEISRGLRPVIVASLGFVIVACGSNAPTTPPPALASGTPRESAAVASSAQPPTKSESIASVMPTTSTPLGSATPSGLVPGASIAPASFVAVVDNPWFPLKPGSTWTYRGVKDGEKGVDTMTVTSETKVLAGVTCVV